MIRNFFFYYLYILFSIIYKLPTNNVHRHDPQTIFYEYKLILIEIVLEIVNLEIKFL